MTTYHDVIDTIRNSSPADWHVIGEWGPMYLDSLSEASNATQRWVQVNSHSSRATYMPDVQLGVAWGMSDYDDKRSFSWANFPDPDVYTTMIDVLWNGSLIDRYVGIVVDGARAKLPMPELDTSVDPPVDYFSAIDVDIFRLVEDLSPAPRFDEYLGRTGLDVR